MLIHPALQFCVHVNRSDTMYVLHYTCVRPKWLWQGGELIWDNYVIVYSYNISKKTDSKKLWYFLSHDAVDS